MKKIALLSFAFFSALMCCAQGQYSGEASEWSGTGWALNNGYVVTNHHVADGGRTFLLTSTSADSAKHYRAEVVALDETNDLAILHITDPIPAALNKPPYSVKTELAEVGESIWVLGFPMTQYMGSEIKLTNGIVSSHSGFEGERNAYQISAPIQPGNSGGPMFDEDGNVVGVVNASYVRGENVNYAIKACYLPALVSSIQGVRNLLPTGTSLRGKRLPEQVRMVKPYMYYIQVSTRAESAQTPNKPGKGGDFGSSVPSLPSNARVIEFPYVDQMPADGSLKLQRVILGSKETVVEFVCSSLNAQEDYTYIAISPNTYLEIDDDKYPMTRAEGIAILPEQTTISGKDGNQVFRLVFPAIPANTTSFSVIEPESNGWRFYGISIKK